MCVVHMCVPVCACGGQVECLSSITFYLMLLRQGFSPNLELMNLATLAGMQALEIWRFSSICHSFGVRHVPRHLASYLGTRDQYSTAVPLPLNHLLQLLDTIFSY